MPALSARQVRFHLFLVAVGHDQSRLEAEFDPEGFGFRVAACKGKCQPVDTALIEKPQQVRDDHASQALPAPLRRNPYIVDRAEEGRLQVRILDNRAQSHADNRFRRRPRVCEGNHV